MKSRSADQCAKRWQQSLDPDLDRSDWREEEDRILIDAVGNYGRHWKDIQKAHFPGRSKNCIKNRHTVLRRKYRDMSLLPGESVTATEPRTPQDQRLTHSSMKGSPLPYQHTQGEDFLTSQTQTSTPESRFSWLQDDEAFHNWSTPESYSMNLTGLSPTVPKGQQLPQVAGTMPQWDSYSSIVTTGVPSLPFTNMMQQPPMTHTQYLPNYNPQTTPQYAAYASVPGVIAQQTSNSAQTALRYASHPVPGLIAQQTPPSSAGYGSSFYMQAPISSAQAVNAAFTRQNSETQYKGY